MTVCDDAKSINSYISTLEKISAEDIFNFAKEYLDLKHATFAILMPEGK